MLKQVSWVRPIRPNRGKRTRFLSALKADILVANPPLPSGESHAKIDEMAKTGADMNADIGADGRALSSDGKEPVSLMEPLLISEGSRFRGELTDLAVELAARSAGFRRSLPEGIVMALAGCLAARMQSMRSGRHC